MLNWTIFNNYFSWIKIRSLGIQNDPKENIVSHYKELNLQAIKSSQELYPQVRGKVTNKPIVLSTIDIKDNILNLAMVETKFK